MLFYKLYPANTLTELRQLKFYNSGLIVDNLPEPNKEPHIKKIPPTLAIVPLIILKKFRQSINSLKRHIILLIKIQIVITD